jgi:hypothetical protein
MKTIIGTVMVLLCAVSAWPADQTLMGTISDSLCNASHKDMGKKMTDRECTQMCTAKGTICARLGGQDLQIDESRRGSQDACRPRGQPHWRREGRYDPSLEGRNAEEELDDAPRGGVALCSWVSWRVVGSLRDSGQQVHERCSQEGRRGQPPRLAACTRRWQ